MTFRPAGEVRLDSGTDGLLIAIGDDSYIVSLHHLAALTSRRADRASVSRRYPGTGGRYLDVEVPLHLTRSRSGRALVLRTPDGIHTIPLGDLLGVVHGRVPSAEISRVITDAAQLSDAHSKQTTLEVV